MSKTYRTPVVAALGKADVLTVAPAHRGTFHERIAGQSTTQVLLDL